MSRYKLTDISGFGEAVEVRTEKRKPAIAAILSIIAPGLGQIYNGQLIKGVIFYFMVFLLQILMLVAGLQNRFYGIIVLLFFGILSYLFIVGEGFFIARRLKEISLKSYNKWYFYLLFVIVAIGTGTVASNLYDIKPYKISSGAMIPTLLVDERIIINIKYYDKYSPNKSDIIVFQYPKDPSHVFIKRIVATEGDVIESRDKTIFVNGLVLNEPYIQHVENKIRPKDSDLRDNFGPLAIPKGKVFVMGDNRDQSYDSRFWGYVDKTQIIGKALYIYWSKKTNRISVDIK
jgi:signal peptidase I